MLRKFALSLCVALLFSTGAFAQTKPTVEIRHMKDCPEEALHDPSLIGRMAIKPGGTCGVDWGSLYAVDDTFLGIRWDMLSNGTSTVAEFMEPGPDITESLKTCINTGPNGSYVDMWLVPADKSCQSRGDFDGRHRRFEAGFVCNLPTPNCVSIDKLKPLGQQRAHWVIDQSKNSPDKAANN